MTGHTQLAITPRDRFLQAAEKELIAFECREREFQKKDREERAAKLQIPSTRSPLLISQRPPQLAASSVSTADSPMRRRAMSWRRSTGP